MLVKSRNERNPRRLLPAFSWAPDETAGDKPEEGGMTSSHRGPYGGPETCYNGGDSGSRVARPANPKSHLSSIVLCNSSAWSWIASNP